MQKNMQSERKNYTVPLIVLTLLFFMWGFITCMNDILIPFLRKVFELSRAQSMLVQMAFFGAYFVGSLVYFLFSFRFGDPLSKIGYKKGLLIGLIFSAVGTLMFYPAAEAKEFWMFITALFVLALGFTMLQIAANPYVALLGKPETASSRLNLSQAFNSFGTAIAPIIGGFLVFKYFTKIGEPLLNKMGDPILTDTGETLTTASVQVPYLIFSGIFILLAFVIWFTKLPKVTETNIEKGAGALRYRHLVLGMIAIFMYVGGEVSIGSVLINFMNELLNLPEIEAKSFLAFYWGGAMIGRFLGSISLSEKSDKTKVISMISVAIAAFAFLYFAVYIESGFTFAFKNVIPFTGFIVLNLIAFKLGKSLAHRTLMIFALINTVLVSSVFFTDGYTAIWALLGVGLFNSIMWSNIFTLAIKDLGKYTSQASSLLIMMILGGAVLPYIQGFFADLMGGYHNSFFVPLMSYVYLAYYGWKGYIPKKINSNANETL